MSLVKVEYIGKKDVKPDNVAGTGVIWYGAGDVQEVPAEAALRMARHPDVWLIHGAPAERTLDDTQPTQSTAQQPNPFQGLYGTDKLPSLVDITDTQQAQLGDIVRGAFAESDMTPDEWNALEPEIRDELIQGHVEKLRAAFAKSPTTKPAAKKAAPAKKAAAKRG